MPLVKSLSGKQDALPASRNKARAMLPFHFVQGAVIFSDALTILAASVLTGIIFFIISRSAVGPIEMFLGVGTLTFVNFSAILAARGAYQPQNLANFWWQAARDDGHLAISVFRAFGSGFFVQGHRNILAWRDVGFFRGWMVGDHRLAFGHCPLYRKTL